MKKKEVINQLENFLNEINRRKEDQLLKKLYDKQILDELSSDVLYIKVSLEGSSNNEILLSEMEELQIHFDHMKELVESDLFSPLYHLMIGLEFF
ncbi:MULTISPECIES: hypothetical protein [unclassified Niallia]|uniref:hypothetical protein n=1 Tax=unclassified Niallia TaxID=2837522 RepID=UPI0030FC591E